MRGLSRLGRAAVLALVVVVIGACGDGGGGGDDDTADAAKQRYATRTVAAGEVTVKITPARIDRSGAAFEVVFDTHSVDLDLDVAERARLVVGGTPWGAARWAGAPPGGHHREGTLRFDATGEPTGSAALTIDGLAEPIEATWPLSDS